MSQKISTVKLSLETKKRLDNLKLHPKESYEEITQRILSILNLCKLNPLSARARLLEIDTARKIRDKQRP